MKNKPQNAASPVRGRLKLRTLLVSVFILAAAGLALFYVSDSGESTQHRETRSQKSPQPAQMPSIENRSEPLTAMESTAPVEKSPTISEKTPSSSERMRAEVDEMIESEGPEAAADRIGANYKGGKSQQAAAMERLTASWAESDPVAASRWLTKNTSPDPSLEGGLLEPDVWEAAVSGYLEGVAEEDTETAVLLAGLLRPSIGVARPAPVAPDLSSPTEAPPFIAEIPVIREPITESPALEPPVVDGIEVPSEPNVEVVSDSDSPDLDSRPEALRRLREIHGFE